MFYDQQDHNIRCEWGLEGIHALVPHSDCIVIIDVLSFSTCVDIAVGRGAVIYPYRWRDESAARYAEALGAELASFHRDVTEGYSLSPVSLLNIEEGTRLVLPSPNGSTLSLATGAVPTFAGCLRNAEAVARAAQETGKQISVIPAGERWAGGTLRPAIEDLIGAGAIIHRLEGSKSPEAVVAEAAFLRFNNDLVACLKRCSSGKELIERGSERNVELSAELDVSGCAPVLVEGAYTRYKG